MKTIKILLIAVLFTTAYSASAVAPDWTYSSPYMYYTGGNVGIGTVTPAYPLDVQMNMTEPKLSISNIGGSGGAAFRMYDQTSNTDWRFKAAGTGTFKIRDNVNGKDILTLEKNANANSIYVKVGGFVGIGTASPQSALAVNGKITCKEVEVTLTGWPDYVFGKEYKLSPLTEVEKYIKENGHLPGISSAKEIEKNGLSVGEMNKQLMQKVEELTLYIISMQKEINELKQKAE